MSVKSAENRLNRFQSVPIEIVVRVGGCRTTVARVAGLAPGEQILLDRSVGEPFDLLAAGRVIAQVEPIACEDAVIVKIVSIALAADR